MYHPACSYSVRKLTRARKHSILPRLDNKANVLYFDYFTIIHVWLERFQYIKVLFYCIPKHTIQLKAQYISKIAIFVDKTLNSLITYITTESCNEFACEPELVPYTIQFSCFLFFDLFQFCLYSFMVAKIILDRLPAKQFLSIKLPNSSNYYYLLLILLFRYYGGQSWYNFDTVLANQKFSNYNVFISLFLHKSISQHVAWTLCYLDKLKARLLRSFKSTLNKILFRPKLVQKTQLCNWTQRDSDTITKLKSIFLWNSSQYYHQ